MKAPISTAEKGRLIATIQQQRLKCAQLEQEIKNIYIVLCNNICIVCRNKYCRGIEFYILTQGIKKGSHSV